MYITPTYLYQSLARPFLSNFAISLIPPSMFNQLSQQRLKKQPAAPTSAQARNRLARQNNALISTSTESER